MPNLFLQRGFRNSLPKTIAGWVGGALLLAAGVWLGRTFGWLAAVGYFAALAGWGVALFYRAALLRRERHAQEEQRSLLASRDRLDQFERRLQAMLALNQRLAEASAGVIDGQTLMDAALSTITALVGGLGCSFVPIDEWQQPLPPFTHGQLPEAVLSAWATQLANGMLRERCGSCKILESHPGACPLHPAQVGNVFTVYCIPHNSPDSNAAAPSGVLHLYLPPGRSLDAEMVHFLDGLLGQVGLAYRATLLRQQEQVTLRQLQMLHAPEGDFSASLDVLLEGIVEALEASFALIRVRPTADERLPGVSVQFGDLSAFAEGELDRAVDQALAAALQGQPANSPADCLPVWLALPLLVPDGALPDGRLPRGRGVLFVGVNHPYEFHPRQRVILQAVAAQAALMVENEHLIRSLEYKIVIQERARLAREIHDGLAQTLAFLKLQSAQMQTYLAQGDLTRLSHILKDNYQALAEAYLDTRQAIDDLRITPQDGLEHWLERILAEFENVTRLPVERNINPLSHPYAPEVQAQLVRIVQEALSNVRKHAHATHVQVSLFERDGETILEVHDDGQGFSAEELPDITRHGLRGMRERAEMLGADFQIISQAYQGTTMRLALPASIAEETSP
jgi:signal transduction histidine kinase